MPQVNRADPSRIAFDGPRHRWTIPGEKRMMILHCVRHGESLYNAEGRVQGQSDVALSELGHRQSHAVAEALSKVPVDAVYASPLRRALETAQVVAQVLGREIRTDPRLKEVNAGIFQDRLRSELEKLYPNELARWLSGEPDFVIPGGESRRELGRRGQEAFSAITCADHDHVVVVGHGRMLVVTLSTLLGLPGDRQLSSLQNGSITTVRTNGQGQFELLELNRVDHLQGIGTGGRGDL